MIPGWYDDPFAATPGLLRWWDGATWTSHVTSQAALAPVQAPNPWALFAPDPQRDLDDELRSARLARIALIVAAVLSSISMLASGWLFSGLRKQLRDIANGNDTRPSSPVLSGRSALIYPVSLLALGATVFFMIWLYRAATLARRAGIPARREPVWGIVGFFVPIVSFWFPYQVAADCLQTDDPNRRLVAAWWSFQIAQLVLSGAAGVTALFSTSAALIVGIAGAVAAALNAYNGIRMIDAIGTTHRRLLPRAEVAPD